MKAIDPRRTILSLPTLSVRAIKLVLALIVSVTGVRGYCVGFSGSAAPAAERQEEILDEAANFDAILREIEREDSNRIGVDKKKALKGAFTPVIPKTWDDQAIASLEVPPADPAVSRAHVSADYYYRIPVRPIYKSYPVYAPGKEPAGYEEWLKQQEPETVFDASKLKTEADWIKAGEVVFDAPIFYDVLIRAADVKDPLWHEKTGALAAKDGTLPYFRYIVREKGKVELGTISCAMCHTRVMRDGTVIKGAQGNFPFELAGVHIAKQSFTPERLRILERSFFSAPWVKPDPLTGLDQMSPDQVAEWHAAIPTGVIARHGSSPFYPTQVPDLIGVEDRKYLDHTGLQLHRSIADMMRYSALNQGADLLASYG